MKSSRRIGHDTPLRATRSIQKDDYKISRSDVTLTCENAAVSSPLVSTSTAARYIERSIAASTSLVMSGATCEGLRQVILGWVGLWDE